MVSAEARIDWPGAMTVHRDTTGHCPFDDPSHPSTRTRSPA
jgi:hypothetical protein